MATYSTKGQDQYAKSQAAKAKAASAGQANRQMSAASQAARAATNAANQLKQVTAQQAKISKLPTKNEVASTVQGRNMSVGTPTGTRGTLTNDMRGGPTSGPGAPLPATTPNAAIVPDNPPPSYTQPAGGNMSSMVSGYNTGAPATTSYQGGATGGMSGGMPNTGMPNTSMLPAGAAFKRGGSVRAEKMSSGGMTSKASLASKRGDGIAQRGKTKGRMV